jgi:peptidoglycan/xylan/chitin deacetylase (PgdA/CDA1 family)
MDGMSTRDSGLFAGSRAMGRGDASIQVLRRVAGAGPCVALTFDDCNDQGAWLEILSILEMEDAHASFFPSGMRVEQFPEAAQRTVSLGHAVGSHGWNHASLRGLALEAIEAQLLKDIEAWQGVGVDSLCFFRPPYGDYDERILRAAEGLGFSHLVLWDVDPRDWETPDACLIEDRVLRSAQPGSIVELHVTEPTARALRSIIAGLRRKKLQLVSLVTLLRGGT